MFKLVLVAITLVVAVGAQYPNSVDSGYGAPGGFGSGGAGGFNGGAGGGNGGGARASAPIESESNLELENEGLNLPSDIIGQDLLDRVVDAMSRDLAEQEAQGAAARAAAAAASGAYGAPQYGPPPSQAYGVQGLSGGAGGANNGGAAGAGGVGNYGQIVLLIPPRGTDPLKARLIANYIQRTTGAYTPKDNGLGGGAGRGGYDNGAAGGARQGY